MTRLVEYALRVGLVVLALFGVACSDGDADGNACETNADCPLGQHCGDDNLCTLECREDADCPNGTCSSLGMCVGATVDAGAVVDAPPVDAALLDAEFLLAVGVVVAPDPPMLFLATISPEYEHATGAQVVDMTLSPLHRFDRTPLPGADLPTGAVGIGASGAFELMYLNVVVPGDANPITGSTLTLDMTLDGQFTSSDFYCGTVSGSIKEPTVLDLAGSTFAAVRVEPGTVGQDLPTPVASCP